MSCEAENSESMENKEKQGFLKKISSPKKEIVIAGIVTIVIGVVLFAKKSDITKNVSIQNPMKKANIVKVDKTAEKIISKVKEHVRKLPEGKQASISKKADAIKNGCKLKENETFVKSYTRNQTT